MACKGDSKTKTTAVLSVIVILSQFPVQIGSIWQSVIIWEKITVHETTIFVIFRHVENCIYQSVCVCVCVCDSIEDNATQNSSIVSSFLSTPSVKSYTCNNDDMLSALIT